MTQTTLRNGGVDDAVDPADLEATLAQLGLVALVTPTILRNVLHIVESHTFCAG